MASTAHPPTVKKGGESTPHQGLPGKDINISDPSGVVDGVVYGGIISEWERIDRLLMRRRMTNTLLVAVLLLIVTGLTAGVLGVAPTIIAAMVALIAGPATIVFRYYFNG